MDKIRPWSTMSRNSSLLGVNVMIIIFGDFDQFWHKNGDFHDNQWSSFSARLPSCNSMSKLPIIIQFVSAKILFTIITSIPGLFPLWRVLQDPEHAAENVGAVVRVVPHDVEAEVEPLPLSDRVHLPLNDRSIQVPEAPP
jgi:hypothetical protein